MKTALSPDLRVVNVKVGRLPKANAYMLIVGPDAIANIESVCPLGRYSKILVLTDPVIWERWGEKLAGILPKNHAIITIPCGEHYKNFSVLETVLSKLRILGADRGSLLLNFGGGLIGDLGGFAAAIYMRGIPFVQIPTTLLAQVDASVGGKTGIDFAGIKNLVGAFQQPRAVIADTKFLTSLPPEQLRSGFAEVVKHGCICDANYFDQVTVKAPELLSADELGRIVEGSAQIKLRVVVEDPTEKGIRKILNFGHTVGHALEILSLEMGKPLLHGEAVSIGMVAEAKLSQLLERLSERDFTKIEKGLEAVGLPIRTKMNIEREVLWRKMRGDKKNSRQNISWTLLRGIGQAEFDQTAPEVQVNQALDYIFAKPL